MLSPRSAVSIVEMKPQLQVNPKGRERRPVDRFVASPGSKPDNKFNPDPKFVSLLNQARISPYNFQEVPRCQKDLVGSVVLRISDRDELTQNIGELYHLCWEANRRKQINDNGSIPSPVVLPPLDVKYMADRLDIDDPLKGYMVRDKKGGWLQGFICVTTFTHWQLWFEWNSLAPEAMIHKEKTSVNDDACKETISSSSTRLATNGVSPTLRPTLQTKPKTNSKSEKSNKVEKYEQSSKNKKARVFEIDSDSDGSHSEDDSCSYHSSNDEDKEDSSDDDSSSDSDYDDSSSESISKKQQKIKSGKKGVKRAHKSKRVGAIVNRKANSRKVVSNKKKVANKKISKRSKTNASVSAHEPEPTLPPSPPIAPPSPESSHEGLGVERGILEMMGAGKFWSSVFGRQRERKPPPQPFTYDSFSATDTSLGYSTSITALHSSASNSTSSGQKQSSASRSNKRKHDDEEEEDSDDDEEEEEEENENDAKHHRKGNKRNGTSLKSQSIVSENSKATLKNKPDTKKKSIDFDGTLSQALEKQERSGDPTKEGVVWPRVAEISLLGAIGCGGFLVKTLIAELEKGNEYDFIVLQATDQSLPFYESIGFTRVGAIAKYAKRPSSLGSSYAAQGMKVLGGVGTRQVSPEEHIVAYRHWTFCDEPLLNQVEASKMMAYQLKRNPEKQKAKAKSTKLLKSSQSVKDDGDYVTATAEILSCLKRRLVKVAPPIQPLPPLPPSQMTPLLEYNSNGKYIISKGGNNGVFSPASIPGSATRVGLNSSVKNSSVKKSKKTIQYEEGDLKIPCPCATCDLMFPSYHIMYQHKQLEHPELIKKRVGLSNPSSPREPHLGLVNTPTSTNCKLAEGNKKNNKKESSTDYSSSSSKKKKNGEIVDEFNTSKKKESKNSSDPTSKPVEALKTQEKKAEKERKNKEISVSLGSGDGSAVKKNRRIEPLAILSVPRTKASTSTKSKKQKVKIPRNSQRGDKATLDSDDSEGYLEGQDPTPRTLRALALGIRKR